MLNIILLLILITYQIIMSVMDVHDMKKYKKIEITEKVKLHFYKEAIIYLWIPILIIGVFTFIGDFGVQELGLRKITLGSNIWLNVITLIASLMILCILIYQVVLYFINDKYREELAIEIERRRASKDHYERVTTSLVIPGTIKEKQIYFFVSLSAGICEEVIWRGCLLYLLADIFPSLPFVVIGGIACILFGLFHCYQGWYGILKTGFWAILFVLIYWVTDSLILGIVLHFLFDFSSAFMVREKTI